MHKRNLIVLAASFLLIGAGCGKPSASVTSDVTVNAEGNVAAPATTPASGGTSLCDNPYYPIKPGYSISYATTFAGKPSGGMTMTVENVSGGQANLSYDFEKGVKSAQTVSCVDGDLKVDTFFDAGSASGSTQMKFTTTGSRGVLMPKTIVAGTTWEGGFDVNITSEDPQLKQFAANGMTGSISSKRTAVAEESVTVPAGTYTAMKVTEETTVTMVIPGLPITPPPTKNVSTAWYVKGVGMVKQETKTPNGVSTTVATKVVQP